jgi:hypothetical protein
MQTLSVTCATPVSVRTCSSLARPLQLATGSRLIRHANLFCNPVADRSNLFRRTDTSRVLNPDITEQAGGR